MSHPCRLLPRGGRRRRQRRARSGGCAKCCVTQHAGAVAKNGSWNTNGSGSVSKLMAKWNGHMETKVPESGNQSFMVYAPALRMDSTGWVEVGTQGLSHAFPRDEQFAVPLPDPQDDHEYMAWHPPRQCPQYHGQRFHSRRGMPPQRGSALLLHAAGQGLQGQHSRPDHHVLRHRPCPDSVPRGTITQATNGTILVRSPPKWSHAAERR